MLGNFSACDKVHVLLLVQWHWLELISLARSKALIVAGVFLAWGCTMLRRRPDEHNDERVR